MGARAKYTASGFTIMVFSCRVIDKQKKAVREPQALDRFFALDAQRVSVSFDVSVQSLQAALNVGMPSVELVEVADLGITLGR